MAVKYVRSGAGGAGTGADWANAYTTLTTGLAGISAGDTLYVSEDHAESTAGAVTLNGPGTVSTPIFVVCVDHLGSVPPVSADLRTTATVTTTGANSITFGSSSAHAYYYGITFNAGTGAVTASVIIATTTGWFSFKSCALKVVATGASSIIQLGNAALATSTKIVLDNTPVSFGATGQSIVLRSCRFEWRNTASAIGGTVPTTLFTSTGTLAAPNVLLEGVDLSAAGSGNTIVGAIASAQAFLLKDCKLGASVTVAATPTAPGAAETVIIRSDSGATNYRTEKYQYVGTLTTETTIVRTGGASDGTTPIAWKIDTTANSKWVLPFDALPIAIWNDTVGSSVTLTLYGIWGGGAVPNNDDVWIEVEYLGASGNPQGSFVSASKADNLAAGSALTSDSSTWGGSTTKFKMSVTFTPQQKGLVYVYVKGAKASSTFYIDPKAVLS